MSKLGFEKKTCLRTFPLYRLTPRTVIKIHCLRKDIFDRNQYKVASVMLGVLIEVSFEQIASRNMTPSPTSAASCHAHRSDALEDFHSND